MENTIEKLLKNYARIGWKDWNKKTKNVQNQTKRQIRVDIAETEWKAMDAVIKPFQVNGVNGKPMQLIPMPCMPRNMPAAFFVPWIESKESTDIAFDLVVLPDQSPHPFAFRFEPAEQDSTSSHGYSHVQLSKSLGKRRMPLNNVPSHFPTSYPAFPIPSKDPLTRFLMMAVTMHGFSSGFNDVLDDAFQGDKSKYQTYRDMTKAMLQK